MKTRQTAARQAATAGDADCPIPAAPPTDVVCPDCGAGRLVPARGRFGLVYRCDAAVKPRCRLTLETRPTGAQCAFDRDGAPCGALIVEGTKTIADRCSDRTCANRNPHKLAAAPAGAPT